MAKTHPRSTRPATPADAREVATRVLFRVATDEAWASPTLDAEIRRAGLDARDAALAASIAYGALRVLPSLDAAVDRHIPRAPHKLDAWARAALRAASFQILHLGRVPPHAAVDRAVGLVRRDRGPRLGGLVNAVLRKVAAERPAVPAPPARMEVPGWIARELGRSLGEARAAAFLEARPLPPPIDLRVTARGGSRERVAAAIAEARPEAQLLLGSVAPTCVRVIGGGDPRALPGFDDGWFAVQEQGSQAIGWLVGAAAGERVADACAGRGGKTAQLAEAVGASGRVTAIDLHEARLEQIPPLLARLHVTAPVSREAIDLSVGAGGLDAGFDRVLVDAPCSGLGTLHRRPELALRLAPEDLERMAALQRRILRTAARLVRPGGTLVYAVCSPARAEGAEVAALATELGLAAAPPERPWPLATVLPDEDGAIRLGPWIPGSAGSTDGYQVFRWIRV